MTDPQELSKRDPLPFLPLTPAAFQVLLTLADGLRHGYLILKEVDERTNGEVRLARARDPREDPRDTLLAVELTDC